MKKITAIIVLAAGLFSGTAQAQIKIGYVRIDDIVGVMPELAPAKVNMDTVGQKFVKDSILPGIEYKQNQYNEKLQAYADTTKKLAPQVKTLMLKEINDLQAELSNADQFIQQVLQAKQQEFLRPYYEKAKKAIDQVAKEKGYTHIVNTDVFLVAPEADDISMLVLAKLNIKLPENKPAGAQPPAGGTKPPVKNN